MKKSKRVKLSRRVSRKIRVSKRVSRKKSTRRPRKISKKISRKVSRKKSKKASKKLSKKFSIFGDSKTLDLKRMENNSQKASYLKYKIKDSRNPDELLYKSYLFYIDKIIKYCGGNQKLGSLIKIGKDRDKCIMSEFLLNYIEKEIFNMK